jgi:hypothetical protein
MEGQGSPSTKGEIEMVGYEKIRISRKNETVTLWDVYSQQFVTIGFERLATKNGAYKYLAPMPDDNRKKVLKAMYNAGYEAC